MEEVVGELKHERDIEELRRIALIQHAQIQQLVAALSRKCRELELLKGSAGELQATLALIEQLTTTQSLLAPAPAAAPMEKQPRAPRAKSGPTAQPRLPIIEQVFTADDADRACPSCGGNLIAMAGQFETSEMIDVVEISYRVVAVKQQKYVCRCGGCVETAPGPERAQPGSRYSLDFAIKAAVDKYLDHIPLERQVRILDRHGLTVTSQTLWDLSYAVTLRLASVDAALMAHVKAQPVIGLDQTSWPRLEQGASKPWQMWALSAPGVVVHRIRDDKSATTFVDLVGDYQGVIVCDALATHGAGARDGPGITLAGCWAHVFRKFDEATPDHPQAARALAWIGALYDVDERAGDDVALRAELRRTNAPPILDELKAWLWTQAAIKTLSIGNAAAYTLTNWDRLTVFVDNPLVPLDNNATERAFRGPVVGRKNHYGSKSRRGTQVAATMYTIFETAKLHRVDPVAYVHAAVIAADRGEVLLPWQFAATVAAVAPSPAAP